VRKTTALLGALLGGLLVCGSASAEMKIGYLNFTRVLEDSPQYAAARKSLQAEKEQKERDLNAKIEQLKKLEEKAKRDAAVMSSAEVQRLERDIRTRQRKLKNTADEYNDEMSLRLNEERKKLYLHIKEVVRKIGKEEGFDLIVTPESVAYANDKIDITDKVLSRLNRSR